MTATASERLIDELGRKYLWWRPIDGRPFSEERVIAQIMNVGTYDDIQQLEAATGRARLADVVLHAEPGWFSDRSWEFWRGRLSLAIGAAIPERAPQRAFDVEPL